MIHFTITVLLCPFTMVHCHTTMDCSLNNALLCHHNDLLSYQKAPLSIKIVHFPIIMLYSFIIVLYFCIKIGCCSITILHCYLTVVPCPVTKLHSCIKLAEIPSYCFTLSSKWSTAPWRSSSVPHCGALLFQNGPHWKCFLVSSQCFIAASNATLSQPLLAKYSIIKAQWSAVPPHHSAPYFEFPITMLSSFIKILFKSILLLFLFYIYEIIACMYLNAPKQCNVHRGQKNASNFPRTWVMDDC